MVDFLRSSETASQSGVRARVWLLGLYELLRAETRIPLASVLQCLAGCWICEQAFEAGTGEPNIQSFADEVQRRLDGSAPDAFSALISCDAALVLLSAGILRALNRRNEKLERFVQQVASSLETHEDQSKDPDLFPTRFLFHHLGLQRDLGSYRIQSPGLVRGTNLFLVDESVIRSVTAAIAASTAYGQQLPSADPEFIEQLTAALPVWMLYYFRQYNLEMGTLLLRSMNYLRLREDLAFQMGLSFVIAQQQPDGRFGFFAPEVSHLRSTGRDLDEVFELYLPLTVSCLWAVAELTVEGFILSSSPASKDGRQIEIDSIRFGS